MRKSCKQLYKVYRTTEKVGETTERKWEKPDRCRWETSVGEREEKAVMEVFRIYLSVGKGSSGRQRITYIDAI